MIVFQIFLEHDLPEAGPTFPDQALVGGQRCLCVHRLRDCIIDPFEPEEFQLVTRTLWNFVEVPPVPRGKHDPC